MITPGLSEDAEIENRISKAQGAFEQTACVTCDKRIKVELRTHLYQALVLSILLAGCETWALTSRHMSKLQSFHHKCCRRMCGLTLWHNRKYHISMENILSERLNLLPIEKIFYLRQLRFLHRVANMGPSRLTFQILTSQVTVTGGSKGGSKTNTRTTWKQTLRKAGLSETGDMKEWIPNLCSINSTKKVEETLAVPPGTFEIKQKSKQRPVFPTYFPTFATTDIIPVFFPLTTH